MRIAIDGTAAAGKGTLAKKMAEALSYPYIDTGALYREFYFKTKRWPGMMRRCTALTKTLNFTFATSTLGFQIFVMASIFQKPSERMMFRKVRVWSLLVVEFAVHYFRSKRI